VLQCIASPFIHSKVVPATSYIRDPKHVRYWIQGCLYDSLISEEILGFTNATFSLARDVPVPSLGSKHELEATWKLIRWRNIRDGSLGNGAIWPEVFSDIGRYSPAFLESCLCHFRTWTNTLSYHQLGWSDHATMFDFIVEQALDRDLTTGEAFELARAFASYLTESVEHRSPETVDEKNIIPRPLSYTLAVGSLESARATHLAITLLVVRAARSSNLDDRPRWARWITLMLWINVPKEPGYLDALRETLAASKDKVCMHSDKSSLVHVC
jgi:hypothetical protein